MPDDCGSDGERVLRRGPIDRLCTKMPDTDKNLRDAMLDIVGLLKASPRQRLDRRLDCERLYNKLLGIFFRGATAAAAAKKSDQRDGGGGGIATSSGRSEGGGASGCIDRILGLVESRQSNRFGRTRSLSPCNNGRRQKSLSWFGSFSRGARRRLYSGSVGGAIEACNWCKLGGI